MLIALATLLCTLGSAVGADDKMDIKNELKKLQGIRLIALTGIPHPQPQTADEIMQRVRKAMNFSLEKIPDTGLILKGKGIYDGVPAKIRLHFNHQGHFLLQLDSVIGTSLSGFDGKDVWSKDYDGKSELLELSKRRQSLLTGALYSGLWLNKSSGMAYTMSKNLPIPDEYLLQFTHEASQLAGIISIDKQSMLPQNCKFTSVKGEYVFITWKDTISYKGMKWPRYTEIAIDDTKCSFQWESATTATITDENPFRPQISPPTNVTFDASKAALLEVKKTASGDLLVHPLVNGQDVGWFLFSTGVEGNVLHVRTAKKLGLETYGEGHLRGVGGLMNTNYSRPKSISLGRMTLQNPLVFNIELPVNLDDAEGIPLAGIIGLGTVRCSVIELDLVNSQIALFDPKTYEQAHGKKNWQRLYVLSGLGVEAEFEEHKGIFRLDTASQGNRVAIHSQAVKKLNLLEGREVKDIFIRGFGGEQAVKLGKLKYFKIGGHRHEEVESIFATSETGIFSNQDVIGFIGSELVKPFQIVFDYQNRRIAFVKRDAKDERKALEDAAWNAYRLGKLQEAAEKCQLAIRACEAANVEDQILADSLTLMGFLDVINGKYTQAETSLNRVLAILKKTVGVDHESNTTVLLALGNLNMGRGQYQEAEHHFQKALSILEKQNKEYQNAIAAALGCLGANHYAQGHYQEAENYNLRALKILEEVPNREEGNYPLLKANHGNLKVSQGKYQEAITLYQDSLKILQERNGNDYIYAGVLMGDLARVHGFLNQYETSDILFEKSQSIKQKNRTQTELAEADQLVKKAMENITKAKLSQAEMNLWSALRSYERGLGPDSRKVAEVYELFAKLKETQGKYNESAYYQKRAKQISDQINKGLGK